MAHLSSLLSLLQLADSAFPTGAFAHSYGLESLAQESWLGLTQEATVSQREEALEWLVHARLTSELARTDLPLLLNAHALSARAALPALLDLEALAQATRPVREWRQAGARAGRRLLATVIDFVPTELLLGLLHRTEGIESGPQLPLAFGASAQALDCVAHEAGQAYAFNAMNGQLAAAVRLGILGQRGVQRILHGLKPAVLDAVRLAATIPPDALGGSLPLLEIAGMRHEYARERLFSS